MSSSDRKINYNLRPAKSIERKMILEVLKEVCVPSEAKHYRYVGFGSSFFTDFKLFHKGLNIQDMVSIESKKSNEVRVAFNKPYSCIDLQIGFSSQVLPRLNWDKKNIVWLDYEGALSSYMFDDIETCATNLVPGSFLIITLRRRLEQETREEFEEIFKSNSFVGLKNEDLQESQAPRTICKMFENKITDVLDARCAAYSQDSRVQFRQLFDFTYKDGEAKMYTFGGMFIGTDQISAFDKYNFNSLDFVGKKEKAYDISFPIITNKEYHVLNEELPNTLDSFLGSNKLAFIPKEHRESYFNTYKFYPAYIEIMDL